MKNVGFIGLGDMGSQMAMNLKKNGFQPIGFDLSESRMEALREIGGATAATCSDVGTYCDVAFVMVMNGTQVKNVVRQLGESMQPGSTIIVTATIHASEIREAYAIAQEKGLEMIDSPVSGGLGGAQNATLTLMPAAKSSVLEANRPLLEAISSNILYVGEQVGAGQTVKASLQAYIGASFTAIFESLVLGAKAGVDGKVLFEVFGKSAAASPLFNNCAKLILDRKFEKTGSHIATMYKDLSITMAMAKENGVPMFTTASAFELFQAGKTMYPEGDNWSIVKMLEKMADTKVEW
ncbi:hypothetical protein D515_02607 [Grimontia indica]|uniref:3-hydroxyisobutyrate dehydrogenase n=1 Tax=Grimontia indica TaxID=1056512 RepID=R1ITD3_9GAMM|nr:NAD(P)-dependent oxidoreductase [Grimontia indica]EOD78615.1 hypothetical protein D515_02607 [Grimontia indica]